MSRLSGRILYDEAAIAAKVEELGSLVTRDHEGSDLVVLGVLKGSFVFLADLVRKIRIPCRVGFVTVRRREPEGPIEEIAFTHETPVEGRNVLLVEDILDTGVTLDYLADRVRSLRCGRLKTCVLLDKPARRRTPFRADYVGFEVPDVWVVGYGLDDRGLHRNLPHITSVEGPA